MLKFRGASGTWPRPTEGSIRSRQWTHHKKSRPQRDRLFWLAGRAAPEQVDQDAASFSFFSGRTLTFTEAGLAANHCSSLVNGLMPLRRGLAGTFWDVILSMPGSVNEPTPRLLIEPAMVSSSAARTARTSLEATPVLPAMWDTRPDLVSDSLIALGAAGLAGAFFAAVFLVAFFTAFFAMFPVPYWMMEWSGRTHRQS